MAGEPQDIDDKLITIENDPIYFEGITPEELMEILQNYDQPDIYRTFFNNLNMHFVDPAYLEYDDPQLQEDLQETKEIAESKYLKRYKSAEEALNILPSKPNDEQILLLSYIYIRMLEKGYPRYHEEKPCLVR